MTICIQLLLVYLSCCRDWKTWVGKGGNPFQNASAINVIVSVYLEFIRLLICNLIQQIQTPIRKWGALWNRPTTPHFKINFCVKFIPRYQGRFFLFFSTFFQHSLSGSTYVILLTLSFVLIEATQVISEWQ